MDIEATPIGSTQWHLTDLLGRPVGTIVRSSRGLHIEPLQGGVLTEIDCGPFETLSLAMSAVARRSRGACRLKDA